MSSSKLSVLKQFALSDPRVNSTGHASLTLSVVFTG